MSDRGSFVTEFIYCEDCFKNVKQVLLNENYGDIQAQSISLTTDSKEHIIAGRIKSGMSEGELHIFSKTYKPMLQRVICCPIRIAVLGEEGEDIFNVLPDKEAFIEKPYWIK